MARQYEFRPAKAAQRRMIVDSCRRLTAIAPLEKFQYVGFGALEFIDFVEFHKGLGVTRMTSIEKDTSNQHRYEFNRPYSSIKLLMGDARDVLPEIDWSQLAIVWLDYTDVLNTDVLRDVDFVLRSCLAGSVVIVTVNGATTGVPLPNRLQNLKDSLGDRVSDSLTDADMTKSGPTREQRRILHDLANSVVRQAHSGTFRQLYNFEYADDAKMLTWGGIVCSPGFERIVDMCRFEDLPFVRSADEAFEIRVPMLTEREMSYLEAEIGGSAGLPAIKGIEKKDIKDFADVYRWRVGVK
ncbi:MULTISPECIES: O-methyltransferase [Rhodococcus]|uniref:O-methyltransferase n=1 Tax=Rhodococcus TaxID=1827 RepID=UPI002953B75B|nr:MULTISPECIES: O-methyltransferase [Rhodococcus]MDV7244456.1 O-methyltransferase [Rhodococcus oxybenzonivorans]MDV7274301.1 O-methyltransferase [Rhodococcus oxybenzonivorans]MDV7337813.1 O-methyltransferase [Rhodococcus oxybenzonivorans]MDV7345251.1 O-methyltransferase [Rhodococcus oxybenzonivorans]MDV8028939.1 O-methyltransferase [Rhodococcus sp. IEGM 27]